ncbi:MAG: hypothetical protein AB8H47_29615 [Bacteroidia bacterium]
MEFIDHSLNWCKGEIFEAKFITLFSALILLSTLLFWRIGTTPGAKAMIIPLLVVGLLVGSLGIGMLMSNSKRLKDFEQVYQADAQAFIQAEKTRTDEFMSWYPITRYIMLGIGLLGIGLFVFWATPLGRAIGISLLLIMIGTFVIDHFSEERADIYHAKIIEALPSDRLR